jgi:hypothetical protein
MQIFLPSGVTQVTAEQNRTEQNTTYIFSDTGKIETVDL